MSAKNRVRKLIVLMFVLIITTNFAFSDDKVVSGFGLSVDGLWYGSIPSSFHQDQLPIRSHFTIGGKIIPVSYYFNEKQQFSSGFSLYYTTKSLAWGSTVWRSFWAIGLTFDYTHNFTNRFSLTGALTPMITLYDQNLDYRPTLRLTLESNYNLNPNLKKNSWLLTFPLSVDLRGDYISLSATVGLKWNYKRIKI